MLFESRSRTARRTFKTTPALVEPLEVRVLLSAGALDRSFDGDGVVTKYAQSLSAGGAISVRPDGTIVLVGFTQTDAGFVPPDPEFVILHFNPDGSVESSFGDDGVATIDVPVLNNYRIDIGTTVFQADGKILISGRKRSPTGNYEDFLVVRLNPDGSRDTSFGNDGYATVNFRTRESATALAIAPDGKILVAGYTTLPSGEPGGRRVFAAFRLNADGTLDTTFGDAGRVTIDETTGTPAALALQSDGKLVLAGGQLLVRLNADGSLDSTFGGDGVVEARSDVAVRSLSILPDGRLLVAGTRIDTYEFAIARFTSDGSLDTSFGDAGWRFVAFGNKSRLNAMAVQADGRIVLTGNVITDIVDTQFGPFQNSDFAVVRLNADGSLDATFGEGGKLQVPVDAGSQEGQYAVARAIALQPDGRIVLGGDTYQSWSGLSVRSTGPFALVRLLSGNEQNDFELIGRANDGDWQTSGFISDGGELQSSVFSHWAPSVNWQHVRTGDFDGNGLTDVAGWDPGSGYWWVSLSDGEGSTVKLAGQWSNATTWSDVAAVDLAAAGDRDTLDHFTRKTDLVGRDQWGHWWAAIANGDGTFSNVLLASWNAAAGWTGTQYVDVNRDGQTDIVSRTSGGAWWGLISRAPTAGHLVYDTVLLATWVGNAAGWHDDVAVHGLFGNGLFDARPAFAARTSDGAWYALDFASDGTATTRFLGKWYEAAGWRDVQAADLDGNGHDEIIGRTSTGGWWSLALDAGTGSFSSHPIGTWNETVGWHDVQTVSLGGHDALVGRNNVGDWWLSQIPAGSEELTDRLIGHWDPNAGWSDVHSGNFTRPAVEVLPPVVAGDAVGAIYSRLADIPDDQAILAMRGDRRGTTTVVRDASRFNGDAGLETGVLVSRTVAGQKREWFFAINSPTTIYFSGHVGVDNFDNESHLESVAYGRAAGDVLDGRDNDAFDRLFGGDGLDTLLGDSSDELVQDGPVAMT